MGALRLTYQQEDTSLLPIHNPNMKVVYKREEDSQCCEGYYPGGMLQPNRHGGENYRYGFGSHENDNEVKGKGNHISFGDYGYDTRLMRRMNIDPLIGEFPSMSSYAVFNNNPIYFADPTGMSPEGGDGDPPPRVNGTEGETAANGGTFAANGAVVGGDVEKGMMSEDFQVFSDGGSKGNTYNEVIGRIREFGGSRANYLFYSQVGISKTGLCRYGRCNFGISQYGSASQWQRSLYANAYASGNYTIGGYANSLFQQANPGFSELAPVMTYLYFASVLPMLDLAAGEGLGTLFMSSRGLQGYRYAMYARYSNTTRQGLTNSQLISRVAIKSEQAIGGSGRFAGTAKHTYASKLLNRYQSLYGSRGIQTNVYFKGRYGKGFLDVLDKTDNIIYDFKFGRPYMRSAQFNKYSGHWRLPVKLVDGAGNIIAR